MDAAESFRDLPGLVLLESARPGRTARWSFLTADPLEVIDAPTPGADPFAGARRLLRRLDPARPEVMTGEAEPPFLGGLAGYLGYDLGHALERLPTIASDDQGLPVLRLALHDWTIAWDRRTERAWLAGRPADGDQAGLERRLAAVRERLRTAARSPTRARSPAEGWRSDRTSTAPPEAGVEAIRAAIANGAIYQANPDPPPATPFAADPGPLPCPADRRSAMFAAYLDLGPKPRAESELGDRDRPAGPGRAGRSHRRRPSRSWRSTPRAGLRPTRSRGRGHAATRRRRTVRWPGSCSTVPRTGPRT
jgi:hypothetical protein